MQHELVRHGAKLSVAITMGIVLGLLLWPLVQFRGWNTNTPWIISPTYSTVVPVFAIAGLGNLVVNALLLCVRSTRSFGSKWISISIFLWLVTSCVVLGAFGYYGPIQGDWTSFLAGSIYLGGAVSFGLVIAPLYLFTVMQTVWWTPVSRCCWRNRDWL